MFIRRCYPASRASTPSNKPSTAGVKVTGCTVHFVDEQVDHGVILLQHAVPVLDEDTAETLSARILTEEHLAYPEAIRRVLSGDYEIRDRRFVRR